MDMFIVKNFLGCFKLETGGLFIGWFTVIGCIIYILLSTFGIISSAELSCEEIIMICNEYLNISFSTGDCSFAKNVVIFTLAASIIISIGFIVIYIILINGIQKRDHILIKPAVITTISLTIYYTMRAIFSFANFFIAIIITMVGGYIYACLNSLYVKIRDERLGTAIYTPA